MAEPSEIKKLSLKVGTLVFDEGDKGDNAYMIAKGAIEIRRTRGVSPHALATLKKGDIFGEMALFDDSPRMAAALAVEETLLLVLTRDEFYARLETVDPVLKSIITYMISRVRRLTDEFMARKSDLT